MRKKLISIILSIAIIFQNTSLVSAMNILNCSTTRFYSLDDIRNIFYNIYTMKKSIQNNFRYNPDIVLRSIKNFIVDSKNLDEFFERLKYFRFIYSEYVLNLRYEIYPLTAEDINSIRNSNREYLYKILKEENDKLLKFVGYCKTIRMSDDFKSKSEKFSISDVNYEMIEEKTKENPQINTLYKIILKILKLFKEHPDAVIQKMRESANPEHILLANKILEDFFVPAYFLGQDLGDIFIRISFSENRVTDLIEKLEELPTLILTSAILDMREILQDIKNSIMESSKVYEACKY